MKFFLILLIILFQLSCYSCSSIVPVSNYVPKWVQGNNKPYQPISQSNPELDFYNFMKGVTTAKISIKRVKSFASLDKLTFLFYALEEIKNYLEMIGFENITALDNEILFDSPYSICDIAGVNFEFKSTGGYLEEIYIRYYDCFLNSYDFRIKLESKVWMSSSIGKGKLVDLLQSSFNYNVSRDESFTLKLPFEMTNWTEKNLKEHFDKNGYTGLEGIYERMKINDNEKNIYKLGLVNRDDKIDVIYIDGAENSLDWIEGERKATLSKTASANFYTTQWFMANKNKNEDVYTYLDAESGMLTFEFLGDEEKENEKKSYIKLYPSFDKYNTYKSSTPSISNERFRGSGSGFAISKSGLIVTNYHVVDDAKVVKVQLTQLDKSNLYNGKILLSDPKNDLAIIKIEDTSFKGFNNIPYNLKTEVSEMGTNVYALGYPLIDTMGENIKLTDGIISSKMGFQGDITQYQLSVPVQPGNSGGPLFDKNGNVIGVINAKHKGADNATYAIKSNILKNLIESLPNPPGLNNSDRLSKLSLAKQAAIIEDFVVLIKVK